MCLSSNKLLETTSLTWNLKWKEKMLTWSESMKRSFRTWKMLSLRMKISNSKWMNSKTSIRLKLRRTRNWMIQLRILLFRMMSLKALIHHSKKEWGRWSKKNYKVAVRLKLNLTEAELPLITVNSMPNCKSLKTKSNYWKTLLKTRKIQSKLLKTIELMVLQRSRSWNLV